MAEESGEKRAKPQSPSASKVAAIVAADEKKKQVDCTTNTKITTDDNANHKESGDNARIPKKKDCNETGTKKPTEESASTVAPLDAERAAATARRITPSKVLGFEYAVNDVGKISQSNSSDTTRPPSKNPVDKNGGSIVVGPKADVSEARPKGAPADPISDIMNRKDDTLKENAIGKGVEFLTETTTTSPPKINPITSHITTTIDVANDSERSGGIGEETKTETKLPCEIDEVADNNNSNNNNNSNGNGTSSTSTSTSKITSTSNSNINSDNPMETADGCQEQTRKRKRDTISTAAIAGNDVSENNLGHENDSITRGDYGNLFLSSAKDALSRAVSLAKLRRETETSKNASESRTSPPPSPSPSSTTMTVEETKESNEVDIPIEVLRDLINQNPEEFWQPGDRSGSVPSPSEQTSQTVVSKEADCTDLIFYEELNGEKNAEDKITSESQTEQKKEPEDRDHGVLDQETQDKREKEVPSFEDRATLAAVRELLEASIANENSHPSKGLVLEEPKMPTKIAKGGEGEDASMSTSTVGDSDTQSGSESIREMAHKVATSFGRDLREILRAIANAKASIGPESRNESVCEHERRREAKRKREEAKISFLLCDEKLEDETDSNNDDDDDDDDEIIEITPEENFIEQNLICHEKNEGALFARKPTTKTSLAQRASDDLLIAQKVALLRETKRLIRAKTLVLTKRRLGIQEDEDLSIVI